MNMIDRPIADRLRAAAFDLLPEPTVIIGPDGALAGLKVGDLLTHAATQQLIDPADIAKVATPTPQSPLLLRVVRDGVPTFVAITGEAEP